MDKNRSASATEIKPRREMPDEAPEENYRERVVRESRDQYLKFIESINQSSERDIDQAMSRI